MPFWCYCTLRLNIHAADNIVTIALATSVTRPELDAVHAPLQPIVPRSSQRAFQKAIATIAKRINNAKSVVAFPIAGVV